MISIILYCYAINDWKSRLTRQINRLVSSGLYEEADEFFLFVSDPSECVGSEIENFNLSKINLNYTKINYGEAYLALSKLDELAREEKERKIFYFHTKGVFNKYKNFETKELDEIKNKGVDYWVETMEHFLIDKWDACVDKLNDNNIVGMTQYGCWWWGNFWWTKSSHVKNIPNFKNIYNGSRWSVEAWIHASAPNKSEIPYYQFKEIKYDPCYTYLPNYFHNNSIDLSQIKINVIEAKYGYFANQRDEGRGMKKLEDETIDVTDKINKILLEDPKSIIVPDQLSESDVSPGNEKNVRIKFSTNIDPKEEYVITSFESWGFRIFS